jgi:hypothetical protein
VTQRDDVREHLDERVATLGEHAELLRNHGGRVEMPSANREARLRLDVEDCKVFFGAD